MKLYTREKNLSSINYMIGNSPTRVASVLHALAGIMLIATAMNGCTEDNTSYCDETIACPEGERCVLAENHCESVDAGEKTTSDASPASDASPTNDASLASDASPASDASLASDSIGTILEVQPLTISREELSFNPLPVGETSGEKVVTVTNPDENPMQTIRLKPAPKDFTIVDNTCTAPLAPGAICTFKIVFSPTKAGKVEETLTIDGSDVAGKTVLTGTGISDRLQRLSTSAPAALSPAFNPEVLDYTLQVSPLTQQITVGAATVDPTARLSLNQTVLNKSTISEPLNFFHDNFWSFGLPNAISVTTTLGAKRIYRLTVTDDLAIENRTELLAKAPIKDAAYGFAIAYQHNQLAVAAPWARRKTLSDGSSLTQGIVDIWVRKGETWVLSATISPPLGRRGMGFGHALAISGELLAIGAPFDERETVDTPAEGPAYGGRVYLYRHQGGKWILEAELEASNSDPDDSFGDAIAVEGDRVLVGASKESSAGFDKPNDNGLIRSGAAYVFRKENASWIEEAYLKAGKSGESALMQENSRFGSAIALSGDTIAIGAWNASVHPTQVIRGGGTYLYTRRSGRWQKEQTIALRNPKNGDGAGTSVALDGKYLAVGIPREDSSNPRNLDDNGAPNSGTVVIYERRGNRWEEDTILKAARPENEADFGYRLSLDANLLAVAAPRQDGGCTAASDRCLSSGTVTLFRNSGRDWRGWETLAPPLRSRNPRLAERFGNPLVAAEGQLFVGMPRRARDSSSAGSDPEKNKTLWDAGAVQIFR